MAEKMCNLNKIGGGIDNHYSTNRIAMGITSNTKTFTCPSDGLIWGTGADGNNTIIGVNGVGRVNIKNTFPTISLPVFKGDVISVINGTGFDSAGGYFYPKA